MILTARTILTMDGPPLENGGVAVDDNLIVAVGPLREVREKLEGPVLDLGEVVLLPGLINAHCHLDYTTLKHAISPPKSFTAWVQRINAIKRSLHSEDYLAAIARGYRELKRWGTTTVCNIESFPELMPLMPEPLIRTWWFYEMIDIRHRITTDDVVRGALTFFSQAPHRFSQFGLSPHAPYTASRSLYELADACAATMQMRLTTHVAESREEWQMFRDAEGPLYDFMRALGRPMDDCGMNTPFGHLWSRGVLNSRWILAHMNELNENDFQALAAAAPEQRPHLVHCPGSHAYFRHQPFPYMRLAASGVNICVGTDSLASTNSLSLFDELRLLQKTVPELTAEELVRTVTVNPARALRQEGLLGTIKPGALADLIALPVQAKPREAYEAVVDFRAPVPWMMLDGELAHV